MISYDKKYATKAKKLATECLPDDYKLGDVVNLANVCKKIGIGAEYDDSVTKVVFSSERNAVLLPRGEITPHIYLGVAMAIGEKVMNTKNNNAKYTFAIELLLPYEYMRCVSFYNGFAFEEIAQKYRVTYLAVQTREATLFLHETVKRRRGVQTRLKRIN